MKMTAKSAAVLASEVEFSSDDETDATVDTEAKPEGKTWAVDDPELPKVFERMVRRVCPPCLDHCVEDLAQEGLLRLTKRCNGTDGETRRFNSTYLWTTATNLKREALRRRVRHESRQTPLRPANDEEGVWEPPDPSPHHDPERKAIGSDLGRAVRSCLTKLLSSRRRVVTLRLMGYSVSEIARFFEWNLRRAENLALRGLTDLRRCLKTQGVVI
jgi:RNA polymerase sigma factor (sigma-70 family)